MATDYLSLYCEYLRKHLSIARPLTIVFDGSGGSAGMVLIKFFNGIKDVKTSFIHCTPDPLFSAHGPNPIEEGATRDIAKEILRIKADAGFVFDGDGDRVVVVDDKGRPLSAYETTLMLIPGEAG